MSDRFRVWKEVEQAESVFDRQELIPWWSQERVRAARILVVGAGAVGNEVLKNLALLGVGSIFVADFDTIETSNLSRTVLFRERDVGRRKAEVAANATKRMALESSGEVGWFHGDIVSELGTGVYREFDIVLGCVDNIEARCAINRRCWEAGRPWIDSGIQGLGVRMSLFAPPDTACYECNLGEAQERQRRERYSCDEFRKKFQKQGRVPTVQVAAAIVAGLQVQEAMKLICGSPARAGKRVYYQGMTGELSEYELRTRVDCAAHVDFPGVSRLEVGRSASVSEFLQHVQEHRGVGDQAVIDLEGEQHQFVISGNCRGCGNRVEFYRPNFWIVDSEAFCSACQRGKEPDRLGVGIETKKETLDEVGVNCDDERLAALGLQELGYGYRHTVQVRDNGVYKYFELGDAWLEIFNTCNAEE